MRRFDLIHQVNARGTFVASKHAILHLRRSSNPHILVLSPPLDLNPRWFSPHLAYSLTKYGMSMCVLGLAEELRAEGIAVNALWPRTTIATSAVKNLLGGDGVMRACRTANIMADAAHAIISANAHARTGQFLIDDEVLAEGGQTSFDHYRVDPRVKLQLDLFIEARMPLPLGVTLDKSETC